MLSGLEIPEKYLLDAENIVIAGASLMGLTTAISLSIRGIENITIADRWMGECVRSHEIKNWTFNTIKHMIAPLTLSTESDYMQYKDIEKQLYDHVQTLLGIRLIKKNFHSLVIPRKVLLIDKETSPESEKIELTGVDIFIDCTGTKRAGLNNYNAQQGKPYFIVEPLISTQEPQPVANIRIISASEPLEKLHHFKPSLNYYNYFKMRDTLEGLGWMNAETPNFSVMERPKKNTSLCKGHFYFELPKAHLKK